MLLVIIRNAWTLILRGVLAVLFGLAAFFWPDITLTALVLLFAAYALVDGMFALAAAIKGADRDTRWWALLLEGITGIAIALITVFWPGITATALVYLIAAWAVITGVLEIVAAVRLRRMIQGEWLLALAGAVSVLFGIAVAVFPSAGAIAIIWMIGAYALFFGVLLIALGMRLRSLQRRAQDMRTGPVQVPVR
jgi:uncharacterized membrane protein HdeD (DUF308 family)